MATGFATIGHSNRPLDEVLGMLREGEVGVLIDVRTFPRSRSNPAFNIDTLPVELEEVQIGYRHVAALGGRRPRQPDIDESVNALWRVRSFHNYADYALGPEFGAALAEVVELAAARRVALMCAEAVWWRCHRRIITDYLVLGGHPVEHLMAPGRSEPARPTPGAQRTAEGKVVYPAAPQGDKA
jgi:uncharacterized protein (DUF488 family)